MGSIQEWIAEQEEKEYRESGREAADNAKRERYARLMAAPIRKAPLTPEDVSFLASLKRDSWQNAHVADRLDRLVNPPEPQDDD